MDGVNYVSVVACSLLPIEACFLSIALQKYIQTQTRPEQCQQAGKKVTGYSFYSGKLPFIGYYYLNGLLIKHAIRNAYNK